MKVFRRWAAFAIAMTVVTAGARAARQPMDRSSMFALEKRFQASMLDLWGDDPYMFQLMPRGYYIGNFGFLLTAEVSLAHAPGQLTIFRGPIAPPEVKSHKTKVLGRVPKLRDFLQTTLVEEAPLLGSLGDDERAGIALTIYHFVWEDTADIPSQIVVQARKKDLLAVSANPALRAKLIEMKDLY